MTTLRSMLGAVRRKEEKAKSGSAPYHPTHRDRIIKGKMGFLEKHIRTRKTVSSLPQVCMTSGLFTLNCSPQNKNSTGLHNQPVENINLDQYKKLTPPGQSVNIPVWSLNPSVNLKIVTNADTEVPNNIHQIPSLPISLKRTSKKCHKIMAKS